MNKAYLVDDIMAKRICPVCGNRFYTMIGLSGYGGVFFHGERKIIDKIDHDLGSRYDNNGRHFTNALRGADYYLKMGHCVERNEVKRYLPAGLANQVNYYVGSDKPGSNDENNYVDISPGAYEREERAYRKVIEKIFGKL